MYPRRTFGVPAIRGLLLIILAGILSCDNIDPEQTEEQLRFVEFFIFPTAPYIDKSYIENIPEEEVAFKLINFESEKQAIQEVYRAFLETYTEKNMRAFTETLDITQGIEYGTTSGIVYGWNNVKTYILTNWEVEDCQGNPSWELTDFYMRPKGVKADWFEASARGPMFYYSPNIALQGRRCYNATGRFYFTKKSNKWRIHQIDGAKYFQDDKYKVP